MYPSSGLSRTQLIPVFSSIFIFTLHDDLHCIRISRYRRHSPAVVGRRTRDEFHTETALCISKTNFDLTNQVNRQFPSTMECRCGSDVYTTLKCHGRCENKSIPLCRVCLIKHVKVCWNGSDGPRCYDCWTLSSSVRALRLD